MNKILLACLTLFLSCLSSVLAAEAEFSLKAEKWNPDYSGELGITGSTVAFTELGFTDYNHDVMTAYLKHAIPVLPNVRFQKASVKSSAVGIVSSSFTFDGVTYAVSENVTTTLDLSFTDFTLFYSPIDNWVQFDIGLTGRHFNGGASLQGNFETAQVDFGDWLPMLYSAVRFELPFSGFYVDFVGNFISYDNDSVSDLGIAIGYTTSGLGVNIVTEFGSRVFAIKVDELDNVANQTFDLELEGAYFSLGILF